MTARDDRLSLAALGLLVRLLTERTTVDELADAYSGRGVHGSGRDAHRRAARELEAAGYLVRRRERMAGGRIRTRLEVSTAPAPLEAS